jgi:hypothetical protein
MILNLDDVIVTKKETEALNEKMRFEQEWYDKLAKMDAEGLLKCLYVEVTGRGRKDMIARIQRQYFMAFREAGEKHIAKYIWAQGRGR